MWLWKTAKLSWSLLVRGLACPELSYRMDDLFSSPGMGNQYDTFLVREGFAYGWADFEGGGEIVLLKLEMQCVRSSPN